jgi:hypothetical protein
LEELGRIIDFEAFRVATRVEKTGRNYLAIVTLAEEASAAPALQLVTNWCIWSDKALRRHAEGSTGDFYDWFQ